MNNKFKFGELFCELPKSKRVAKDGSTSGIYPFFVCSEIVYRSNFSDYKEEALILSTGGKANIHYCNSNFSTSTDSWVIKITSDKLDTKYAFYLLESKKRIIEELGFQGSGLKHLDKEFIRNMEIFIPPLHEQKKIVDLLTLIDNLLDQLTLKIQSLYFFRKALFQRLSAISSNSIKVKFGEIIEEIRSGWSPLCNPQERIGIAPGVLKTTAINWDGYTPSENKALPKSLEVKKQSIVQDQDILCTRKGPMQRVGVVCYVEKTPVNLILPDTAFRIRVSNRFNAKFIALVLETDFVLKEWYKKKVGLADEQVNINHGIIKETEIPIPSATIQDEFVELFTLNMNMIDNLKKQIKSLTQLKKGLSIDLLLVHKSGSD